MPSRKTCSAGPSSTHRVNSISFMSDLGILSLILIFILAAPSLAVAEDVEILTGGGISRSARQKIEPSRPNFDFDTSKSPVSPDYSKADAWAALPDKKDEADMAPTNTKYPESQGDAAADVFFIHPTGSASNKYWNIPIRDPEAVFSCSEVMKYFASAFNAAARVYAPRYRQATLYAFFDDKTDSGLKAIELAYSDVEAAFIYYIKHYNNGRPFILASHSQGSFHGLRLLQEHIIGKELMGRMVAAYLVGGPIPMDVPGIQPSRNGTDTGTLIGWNTYTITGDPGFFTEGSIFWLDGSYRRIAGRPLVQINPLSWELNGGKVPAEDNPGSLLISEPPLEQSPLKAGICGADASGKVLIIDEPKTEGLSFPDAADDMPLFNPEKGDYHNFDYILFYESIRKNAIDRVRKFTGK